MSNLRAKFAFSLHLNNSFHFDIRFERDLKEKLSQKATSRLSEEQILLKNFKFFDLNNSGSVSLDEFSKTIEKAGIQILNREVFNLFRFTIYLSLQGFNQSV